MHRTHCLIAAVSILMLGCEDEGAISIEEARRAALSEEESGESRSAPPDTATGEAERVQESPPVEADGNAPAEKKVPRLRLDDAGSDRPFPKALIRRVVRSRFSAIRRCYEKGLKVDPKLDRSVTMKFVVAPTGSVSQAAIASSTLAAPQVEECIVRVFQRLKFPRPDAGEVSITYPINLSPQQLPAPK